MLTDKRPPLRPSLRHRKLVGRENNARDPVGRTDKSGVVAPKLHLVFRGNECHGRRCVRDDGRRALEWLRHCDDTTLQAQDVRPAAVLAELDPFDRVQLAYVAAVCQRARTLSDAGREIFAVSRAKRSVTNDADRLKKYLAKFGLVFESFRLPNR